jgi:hypothetical protein
MNYLPGLVLNCDPPDLCFLSSIAQSSKSMGSGGQWLMPVILATQEAEIRRTEV